MASNPTQKDTNFLSSGTPSGCGGTKSRLPYSKQQSSPSLVAGKVHKKLNNLVTNSFAPQKQFGQFRSVSSGQFTQANMPVTNSELEKDFEMKRKQYKMQKKTYRSEKKKVTAELVQTLKDPTVVVMADWLKVRGTLRKWSRFYCVLKPGVLLIYKSDKTYKHGYWVGTVLLSSCELIERPSKKDGFCFKLFHQLDQSIWATRGPRGESLGAVTQPLPANYLICRAQSEEAGSCWMDALELALRCSSLLMRTMTKQLQSSDTSLHTAGDTPSQSFRENSNNRQKPSLVSGGSSQEDLNITTDSQDTTTEPFIDEKEAEEHFKGIDDSSDSDDETDIVSGTIDPEQTLKETVYVESGPENIAMLGEDAQTEEVAEENKSVMWCLMKQVRPGMDLSKVVLPTFILETRSFLEKLSDYYYHADILTKAVEESDPFARMKHVVQFYLSGFYKKPKGLKKPYNPILGERFRCYWQNNDPQNSKTYYIAEQVSHHPPISAFHVTNRQAGFNVDGTILAKSKFYGNSLSALLIGQAKICLLNRGETYVVTLPYAHCKGLILGTLTMEMAGPVTIVCDRTSYACELEFKLKPWLSGNDAMNAISGKIKLGKETMAHIDGHWDNLVHITDKQTGRRDVLWEPTPENIAKRLKRYEVPLDQQDVFESQRLWSKVTEALEMEDQTKATEEKTVIEEGQRARAKALKLSHQQHIPNNFDMDAVTGEYVYKVADYRPWDPQNDLRQLEYNFEVRTQARHRTPLVRTGSLISGISGAADVNDVAILPTVVSSDDEEAYKFEGVKRNSRYNRKSAVPGALRGGNSRVRDALIEVIQPVNNTLVQIEQKLNILSRRLEHQQHAQQSYSTSQLFLIIAILMAGQGILLMIFRGSK